jgi:hypothetical protein
VELESSLVTEADLTEAIDEVRVTPGGGGGIDREQLFADVRALSREVADARVSNVENDLRSRIDERLGGVSQIVQEAVDRSNETLREQILTASLSQLEQRLSANDERLRNEIATSTEDALNRQNERIEERFSGISGDLEATVMRSLEARLSESLEPINSQLGEMRRDIREHDERISANTAGIQDVRTEVGVVRQEGARERSQMRAELLGRIEGIEGGLDPRIRIAIDEARVALRSDIDASVGAAKRDLEGQIGKAARDAAVTEVQIQSTNIRTDVSSMIRQEIDANLAEVRKEISSEVEAINGRVASMVASEVRRSTANISDLVSKEFEALRPEINRMIDTRVGGRNTDSPILTPVDRIPVDRLPIDRTTPSGPIR